MSSNAENAQNTQPENEPANADTAVAKNAIALVADAVAAARDAGVSANDIPRIVAEKFWYGVVTGEVEIDAVRAALLAELDVEHHGAAAAACEWLLQLGTRYLEIADNVTVVGGGRACLESVEIALAHYRGGEVYLYSNPERIPRRLKSDFTWPTAKGDFPYALAAFNAEFAVVNDGGKISVMHDDPLTGRCTFLSKNDFDTWAKPFSAKVPSKNDGEKLISVATAWMESPTRRQYHDVVFAPGKTVPEGVLNSFRGFAVEAKPGNWSKLKEHIRDNICQGNAEHNRWVLTWIAQMLQQPDKKMGSAIVLRGLKGVGKSKLEQWLRKGIGKQHSCVITKKKHLTGDFNKHLGMSVFVVVSEALWAGDKMDNSVLKALITDVDHMEEGKRANAKAVENYSRFMLTSNEDFVVPASDDERRYFVLDVGDEKKDDGVYFDAIDKQMENGGLAGMMHELLTWDLQAAYDAGVNLRKPPMTEGLRDQIRENRDPITHWWENVLQHGGMSDPVADHWHDLIDNHVMRKIDVQACMARALSTHSKRSLETQVGNFLKKYVPNLRSTKQGGGQPVYILASVDEMRKRYDEMHPGTVWEPLPEKGMMRPGAIAKIAEADWVEENQIKMLLDTSDLSWNLKRAVEKSIAETQKLLDAAETPVERERYADQIKALRKSAKAHLSAQNSLDTYAKNEKAKFADKKKRREIWN